MNDEHYKQWLKNLKVGDRVVVAERALGEKLRVSQVDKVTPKGSHRVNGYTGLFKNGVILSRGWSISYYLREPTNELLESIRMTTIRWKLKSVNWNEFDDMIVNSVWSLVHGD